ncbi:hypothetical protein R83H12_00150 [Fibrobacteria bacterium R8-3-H12]
MNTPKLIALFLAVFAIALHAATYYITGSNGSFSASTANAGGVAIANGSNVTIANLMNAIRTDANGDPSTIQFGDNSATLDIGEVYITFNGTADSPAWGTITLTGKITSSANYTIYLTNGTSITSTADIANTASGGSTVYNSSGTVNISGGTITGGTYAVYNNGMVNISGGEVKATTGYAVYHSSSTGKITVSGNAKVTSARNSGATEGTIFIVSGTAEITGGTVENTANSNANAVGNASTGGILLSGNPTVSGSIVKGGTGNLSVDDSFNPTNDKTYKLKFNSYEGIAVAGGASKVSFFSLANNTTGNGISFNSLSVQGNDIVLVATNGYAVENSGTTYTITKGTGKYAYIQNAIDYIRTESNGTAVSIQFGSGGTNVLDISPHYITFNGSATSPAWGSITIAGKITSGGSGSRTIYLSNGASISSTADIANTGSNYGSMAIQNSSTGAVNISGGTVQVTGTNNENRAVSNTGTGTVNISGGTVKNTGEYGKAVHNNSTGTVTISMFTTAPRNSESQAQQPAEHT